MTKYEFKQIALDEFELVYMKNNQEKKIPFKRTIEIAQELNSVDAKARFKMYQEMTKMGVTKQDLIIERKEKNAEGQTVKVIDETNYNEFESHYLLQERVLVIEEIFKKILGLSLEDLFLELEFKDEKDSFTFSTKLRQILINEKTGSENKIPSGISNESIPNGTQKATE